MHINNLRLLFLTLLILAVTIGSVHALSYESIAGTTFNPAQNLNGYSVGVEFVMNKELYLDSVFVNSGATAYEWAYITDRTTNTPVVISPSVFKTSNYFNFTTQNITLELGRKYGVMFVVNTTDTSTFKNNTAGLLPVNTTYINFTRGTYNTTATITNVTNEWWGVERIITEQRIFGNVTVNARNAYTSALINDFTVLFNGTNISTTNNTVILPVLLNTTSLWNITVYADNYFTNTTNNVNLSTTYTATLTPYTQIYAKNIFTNASINNFTITYNNTNYTTTTGTAQIPLYNTTAEVTITPEGYAISTENLTANPYLRNYTFNLYTENSFTLEFRNETTNLRINDTNITIEFISTLYATNTTTDNGTLYVDLLTPGAYEINYWYDTDRPRSYYTTLTNQSTQNITLYLIDEDISTSYVPLVTDGNDNACSQNTVSLMRYYVDINGYRTVAMAQTDTNGYALFYVAPNTINYKLYFSGTCGTFTTVPQKIIASTNSFTVVGAQTYLTSAEAIAGASISLEYINATQTYVFDWQDDSNTITQGCLYIYKTSRGRTSTNYSACSNTNTGSLIYTLTGNLTETIWNAQGIIHTNTEYSTYSYAGAIINFTTTVAAWGVAGVFWGLILLLGVVLMLGNTASTVVIATIGAFTVMATIGMIAGAGSLVAAIIIVGGAILYKMRTL